MTSSRDAGTHKATTIKKDGGGFPEVTRLDKLGMEAADIRRSIE